MRAGVASSFMATVTEKAQQPMRNNPIVAEYFLGSFCGASMKKLLLALTAVAGLTAQASAADMAVKAPMKAPPMVEPVMGWTGLYVGINGGGAWSDGPSMTYVDLANIGNTANAYAPSTVNPSSSSSGLDEDGLTVDGA